MGWTLRLDSEVAGITALCAADASGFVAAFCPSLFTMRTFTSKGGYTADETSKDIYRGLAIGAALSLLAGFGGSAVTRSWWPLLGTLFVLGVILASYQWALQNPREDAIGMADQ